MWLEGHPAIIETRIKTSDVWGDLRSIKERVGSTVVDVDVDADADALSLSLAFLVVVGICRDDRRLS